MALTHVSDRDLDLVGVVGLDFVNTVVRTRDGRSDLLDTPETFLDWIRRVDAASDGPPVERLAPRDPPGLRLLTVEARALRDALVTLFRRVDGGDAKPGDEGGVVPDGLDLTTLDPAAAFAIDRALRGARVTFHLIGPDPGPASRWASGPLAPTAGPPWGGRGMVRTCFEPEGPLAPLTPIALSALDVVRGTDPARLRACAADDCVRWFVDTSKGGRRRWCSMSRCGNRAKVARYRRRHAEDE